MKNITKIFFALCMVMMFSIFTSTKVLAQSGLAESYCSAFMPVINQAIDLRRSGVPVDISMNIADTAFDVNRSLWLWLRGAVQSAYADPHAVQGMIRDESAMRSCVSKVRGY